MNDNVSTELSRRGEATHSSYRIKQTLLYQGIFYAILVALPPPAVAPAHGRPRPVDTRAAAAEEQVVVKLVLLRRRAAASNKRGGRALDGKHDRRVVRRGKNVSAEAVVVRLPPERITLQNAKQNQLLLRANGSAHTARRRADTPFISAGPRALPSHPFIHRL